jgi:hypothetical protein
MMIGGPIQVLVGVGWFAVDFCLNGSVIIQYYFRVKEWDLSLCFGSMVNLMCGSIELMCSVKDSISYSCKTVKVLSTYLSHKYGERGALAKALSSKNSIYRFAITGEMEDPAITGETEDPMGSQRH